MSQSTEHLSQNTLFRADLCRLVKLLTESARFISREPIGSMPDVIINNVMSQNSIRRTSDAVVINAMDQYNELEIPACTGFNYMCQLII